MTRILAIAGMLNMPVAKVRENAQLLQREHVAVTPRELAYPCDHDPHQAARALKRSRRDAGYRKHEAPFGKPYAPVTFAAKSSPYYRGRYARPSKLARACAPRTRGH